LNLIESMSADVGSGGEGTVLLPLGSLEQHGTMAPLGCDGIIAEAVCRNAALEAGCFVLPTLYYGHSECHKGFPGTFSLSIDTSSRLIEEIVRETARNGFSAILLLSGHGGNRKAAQQALKNCPEGIRAGYMGYWDLPGAQQKEETLFGKTGLHITTSEVSMVWHILGKDIPLSFRHRYPPAVPGCTAFPPELWRNTYPEGGVGGDMSRVSARLGGELFRFLCSSLSSMLGEWPGRTQAGG
jgi:creatinine amidohydrolase